MVLGGVGHEVVHEVPLHPAAPLVGAGHIVQLGPHAFSLFETQLPPQRWLEPVQAHLPLTQDWPPVHANAAPQPPQLPGSCCSSTQPPAHGE